ncbi:DUF3429 domain-containing protein [Pseudomaricurvus sp.]|uniref:DUF3429 domain-containing protein n=1 Tax=Pseudomaricurvus sp. TaxID=2004510 RepID=UPI003F6B7D20
MEKSADPCVRRSLTRVDLSLGVLGLIPFIYTALLLPLPWGITAEQAFVAYSVIILTFLAGTLWQIDTPSSLVSNLVALSAVFVMLSPFTTSTRALILMVLYLFILAWELLRCRAHYSITYQSMRCALTMVVVLCHGLMINQ